MIYEDYPICADMLPKYNFWPNGLNYIKLCLVDYMYLSRLLPTIKVQFQSLLCAFLDKNGTICKEVYR